MSGGDVRAELYDKRIGFVDPARGLGCVQPFLQGYGVGKAHGFSILAGPALEGVEHGCDRGLGRGCGLIEFCDGPCGVGFRRYSQKGEPDLTSHLRFHLIQWEILFNEFADFPEFRSRGGSELFVIFFREFIQAAPGFRTRPTL